MPKPKPLPWRQLPFEKSHFFATSVGSWKTGDDLEALLKAMKQDGLPFTVYIVPLPLGADYEIMNFYPQVLGCQYVGHWTNTP